MDRRMGVPSASWSTMKRPSHLPSALRRMLPSLLSRFFDLLVAIILSFLHQAKLLFDSIIIKYCGKHNDSRNYGRNQSRVYQSLVFSAFMMKKISIYCAWPFGRLQNTVNWVWFDKTERWYGLCKLIWNKLHSSREDCQSALKVMRIGAFAGSFAYM